MLSVNQNIILFYSLLLMYTLPNFKIANRRLCRILVVNIATDFSLNAETYN